jgi:hypothetical protein
LSVGGIGNAKCKSQNAKLWNGYYFAIPLRVKLPSSLKLRWTRRRAVKAAIPKLRLRLPPVPGMTEEAKKSKFKAKNCGVSPRLTTILFWIPAFAGMTKGVEAVTTSPSSFARGYGGQRLRRNQLRRTGLRSTSRRGVLNRSFDSAALRSG